MSSPDWEMLVAVPPGLAPRVRELVEQTAERLDVPQEDARRVVEQAILTRGLDAMERERR